MQHNQKVIVDYNPMISCFLCIIERLIAVYVTAQQLRIILYECLMVTEKP